MSRRGACALALIPLAMAAGADAQPRLAGRVEAVRATRWSAESGIGLTGALGTYMRLDLHGARAAWQARADTARWRGEAVARFTMDPLAEQRWGLSIGGGLGYRERAYLAATLDLEGPRLQGLRPAIAVTAGGGLRAGLVLRGAARERR